MDTGNSEGPPISVALLESTEKAEQNADTGFDLYGATQDVLTELGVEVDSQNPEQSKKMIQFLSDHVFDRGSSNTLLPINVKELNLPEEAKEQEEILEADNGTLEGVPILSSGMGRLYRDRGYDLKGFVDMKDMFGLNEISRNYGNRVIRKFASSLVKNFPGCRVVRWAGDEFAIISKDPNVNVQSILQELSTQTQNKAIYKSPGGEYIEKPIEFSNKKVDGTLLNKGYVPPAGRSLEVRSEKLNHFHTEVAQFHMPALYRDAVSYEQATNILEVSLYHPTLQTAAEELDETARGRVNVYADIQDYLYHICTAPEGQKAELEGKRLVRIDKPGALKSLNDFSPEGDYNIADAFLREQFKQHARFLLMYPEIDKVSFFARGSELIAALPADLVDNKDFINGLRAAGGGVYTIGGQYKPLITTVGVASSHLQDFLQNEQSTSEDSIEYGFRKSMDQSEESALKDMYETLLRRVLSDNADTFVGTMDFVTEYFSLNNKRGPSRLRKIGLSIADLNQYYSKEGNIYTIIDQKGLMEKIFLQLQGAIESKESPASN